MLKYTVALQGARGTVATPIVDQPYPSIWEFLAALDKVLLQDGMQANHAQLSVELTRSTLIVGYRVPSDPLRHFATVELPLDGLTTRDLQLLRDHYDPDGMPTGISVRERVWEPRRRLFTATFGEGYVAQLEMGT